MPSTYSNSLRLELQADNENQGNWGSITNRNLGTLIESAVSGVRSITLPDTDYTLTALNGSDDEARYAYLIFNGTLTATRNVIVPTPSKLYAVRNSTNQSIVIKTATGTGVTIPSGRSTLVYSNGVNVLDRADYLSSLTVGGSTVISTSSSTPALRITQTGTGEALRVEDEANPDATPFVIDAAGNVGVGTATPGAPVQVGDGGQASREIRVSTLSGAGQGGFLRGYRGGSPSFYVGDSAPISGSSAGGMTLFSYGATSVDTYTNGILRSTLDSAGNLGLGVTPSANNRLTIDGGRLVVSNGPVGVGNTSSVKGVQTYFDATNNIGYIYSTQSGVANYPLSLNGSIIDLGGRATLTQGGNLLVGATVDNGNSRAHFAGLTQNSNGLNITYGGVGSALVRIVNGNALTFGLDDANGNTERARITSVGDFLVGTTNNSGNRRFVVSQPQATFSTEIINTATSGFGVVVSYAGGAPNNTANEFLVCGDTGANRFLVRSNGGIANFQANNVNLSDRREKTNFAPAKSYLDVICAIPVQTFNYVDQNLEDDPGLTLGVVAQDVQAVAPELVMESNWGTKEEPKMRLSIYQTDLQYALMKCIQEQQTMIAALESRLAALESK